MEPKPEPFGPKRLQPAYKIDTSLVAPLGDLPKPIGGDVPSLAFRNLFRGLRMGLPSGRANSSASDSARNPKTGTKPRAPAGGAWCK